MEITPDMMIEAMARGFQRELERSGAMERLADRVADKICERFEILTPPEAAALLTVAERTLRDNHAEWRLEKSVALGISNPRYFLSQVLARLREKVIKAREGKDEPGKAKLAVLPASRAA